MPSCPFLCAVYSPVPLCSLFMSCLNWNWVYSCTPSVGCLPTAFSRLFFSTPVFFRSWRRVRLIVLLIESPLDCKEIQPVHPKGDQSWVFFGRNDAKAETPVLWPLHAKSWLIGKDSDAGSDWGQEERGTAEDEMAGWHHQLNGREFDWTLGNGDGQGSLACCDSWGRKELDMTEQLNWTELILFNSLNSGKDLYFFPCPFRPIISRKTESSNANFPVILHGKK